MLSTVVLSNENQTHRGREAPASLGGGGCHLPSPRHSDKPALLIELKYDKTRETAVDQIRAKNYPQKLEHYKENLLLIGINYEKDAQSTAVEYKHHSCRIEKA